MQDALIQPCPKPIPQLLGLAPEPAEPKSELPFIKNYEIHSNGFCRGKWRDEIDVAIKVIQKPENFSRDQLVKEANVLKDLQHANVVVFYGVNIKADVLWIISDYIPNGISLLNYLRKVPFDSKEAPPFNNLIKISTQIASGMAYLESKSITHRALMAQNIRMTVVPLQVKIENFQLIRVDAGHNYQITNNIHDILQLPTKWTAPEVLLRHKSTLASRVWSFGVLLYEIFTYGGVPYPNLTTQKTCEWVISGYTMPKPRGYEIPDDVFEVMQCCWEFEPASRPTFVELEEFFGNYLGASVDEASTKKVWNTL